MIASLDYCLIFDITVLLQKYSIFAIQTEKIHIKLNIYGRFEIVSRNVLFIYVIQIKICKTCK